MWTSSLFCKALAFGSLVASVAADVDPIVIKGSHFFYKTNGSEFFIRGVAYQQNVDASDSNSNLTYSDPLADVAGCKRDIPYLKELQTNVVRVYAIDPTQDHSECMQMLADAGIYVISDLSEPSLSINRISPSWNIELYNRYTSVIDALANYTNTLGFFAGNEVSNNNSNTDASAFVKAAVRDMKKYIASKNYRDIGVGYSADDDATIREQVREYFDCGTDAERIDFFGLNIYEWCGHSSYTTSGYANRTQDFSDYDVPVFFSEYGCNTVQPRSFDDVQALYGPEMTGVWSGGIVYMYFQEANDFGLVEVDGDSVKPLSDFTSLSSQLAKISPSSTNMAQYTPSKTANLACPTVDASWEASSKLPPTPDENVCNCMYSTLTCVPDSKLSDEDIGKLLGVVCGLSSSACDGVAANATNGEYGEYSMCGAKEQLGYALNAYYEEQGKDASACNFKGSATTQVASASGGCSAVLSSASAAVTASSTASGSAGSADSTASHSGSKGAAPSFRAPHVFGISDAFQIGAYAVTAVGTGLLMIVL
ncbi:1,3-beta-glucanosyltransferase gas1 [Monascus purpureus]|uniref:1,3-beta-glucanosyltransferase n=1 Tax=Monascus purpureus TaxID=5098 RepID=A0A507QUN0_MONPU|nr:1,3-beta-glucanosyltransferase gas1 [Monascus purpureus]